MLSGETVGAVEAELERFQKSRLVKIVTAIIQVL